MSNLQTLDWLQATHELLEETPAKTFSIKCEAKSLQDTINRMWLMEAIAKQNEKQLKQNNMGGLKNIIDRFFNWHFKNTHNQELYKEGIRRIRKAETKEECDEIMKSVKELEIK